MATPKIIHGARAILNVGSTPVGIFTNVSYGLIYDAQPAYILGRFGPVELAYTGQEPIQVTASGWRVLNHGPHSVDVQVPKLQDLLLHNDITLSISDRQNPTQNLMSVTGVRPTGYTTTISSRQLQEITVTFVGLVLNDESASMSETSAAVFPTT
jgi:hypothetical protein